MSSTSPVSDDSGDSVVKFRKRPFWTENNEEPHNVSQEAGRNNLTGVADQGVSSASISTAAWISELELMLKQKTLTRCETQHLIALLHSRTIEESPTPLIRLEASTSGSLKKHKHGDGRDNLHLAVVGSRVCEEEIASPDEPAKAYNHSTIITDQAPRQDSKSISSIATCLPKSPMALPQQPTTMENLPDELLVNIFIRLYAKQLAQMRSVTRSWNDLLSQSSFVKSHLHHSIHNNDQIFLHFPTIESTFGFEPFSAHPCRSPDLQRTNSIKLPVNPQSEYRATRVVGSVNGLICSSYDDSVIHIWNPSLSAVLTLPPYSTPSVGYESILVFFRFGFDPQTDDYKVVKLTGLIGGQYVCAVKWWLQVEIYSMRKGTWELITERFPSHITYILDDDHVCVDGHNGHLHWRGYVDGNMDSETIVAFNLGSETFCEMPFPDSTLDANGDDGYNILGVLAGKLCVMSWVDGICEVWVMDEYGVVESWVKRHVFCQFSGDTYPFGFTSHNEFLIEDIYGRLVFYDPIADKAKILKNYFLKEHYVEKIVEYVDSLVWVAPAEREMVDGI